MRVLFVCSGNTCRSPMAEELAKVKFAAAGLQVEEVASAGAHCGFGDPISVNAAAALAERGIISFRRSQPVTQNLADRYDLIITMTWQHKSALAPFVDADKLYSMRELTPLGDIPDPYGCNLDAYRVTRDALSRACDIIIKTFIPLSRVINLVFTFGA